MKCKLLLLPFLAFQLIIRQMNLIDLFELSRTSKKTFAKIRLAKKKILPIRLVLNQYDNIIRVSDHKDKEGEGRNFELNFCFKLGLTEVRSYMDLDGYWIPMNYTLKEKRRYPGFFGPLVDQPWAVVLKHLLKLFCCPGICVNVELKMMSESYLAHPILSNSLLVKITDLYGITMTSDILSTILEHTTPKYGLYIDCPRTQDLILSFTRNPIILDLPFLHIRNAQWVRIEDLLKMKCEMIFLDDHRLTEEDVRTFIKNWLESNDQKFFRLRLKKFETEPNWEQMLEGIDYKKFDEKSMSRYFITHSTHSIWAQDCTNGWDFERADKTKATVLQNTEYFEFLIWNSCQSHDLFSKNE